MIEINGVTISDPDAFTLIDLLLRGNTADWMRTADAIDRAIERGETKLQLTTSQQQAVVQTLSRNTPGALVELKYTIGLQLSQETA